MTDEPKPKVDMELVRRASQNRTLTFHAIGKFIVEFSQLEFTIRFALGAYLGLPDAYFDAVTGPYDFRMLCAVTSKVTILKHPERKAEVETLYKECYALNDKRNHVAHGLWTDGIDEFSVRVFNRSRLDTAHVPYSSAELNALADKAQELFKRVMGFQEVSAKAPGKKSRAPRKPKVQGAPRRGRG
jgi:hypothetical protein